jgi:hypothetical protein
MPRGAEKPIETANRNEATSKNAQQQQERLAHRQCGEPLTPAIEERTGADHRRALPQLVQGCEGLVEVRFGARVHDMKLQSESACRLLNGAQYDLGFRSFGSVGVVRATCRRRARRSSLAAESQLQDIHVLSAPAANLGESYRFSQDS